MSDSAVSDSNDMRAPEADKRGIFAKIALFLRQVLSELKKVVTPTKKEWVNYTITVLCFVIVVMLIVSALDFLFGNASIFVFTEPLEQ
ncbi:preprotein translocase subunit SecE [Zhihengliuella sp.]|uniref:preprotein translocase subunit SecE n=1 Tax=Zhihengliuella sp. TaxID=1954483 RepID=UPI002810B0C1|nr:preprotein translocase subunit SecE [Zhihengliuella sp.]